MNAKYIIAILCVLAITVGAVSGYAIKTVTGDKTVEGQFGSLGELKDFLTAQGFEVRDDVEGANFVAVKKGDNGEDNVGFGFGCAEGIDNEGNPIPCDDEKLKDVVYEYYEEDGKMGIKMIDKNPNSMTATATFVTGEDGNPVVKIEE